MDTYTVKYQVFVRLPGECTLKAVRCLAWSSGTRPGADRDLGVINAEEAIVMDEIE